MSAWLSGLLWAVIDYVVDDAAGHGIEDPPVRRVESIAATARRIRMRRRRE